MISNEFAAFPHDILYDERRTAIHVGMTLRDYFAAAAMQGMISDRAFFRVAEAVAIDAYRLADEMLKARES